MIVARNVELWQECCLFLVLVPDRQKSPSSILEPLRLFSIVLVASSVGRGHACRRELAWIEHVLQSLESHGIRKTVVM